MDALLKKLAQDWDSRLGVCSGIIDTYKRCNAITVAVNLFWCLYLGCATPFLVLFG
jgi:hypothetical protein